jgi:prepilin-type N-terminal cleavage/methylation domain-containing protein
MKLSNLLKIEKNIKKNKAFTLVELIVVITILAILWTIAFISYQWYSKDSRDSKRIADINSIQKSLELFITEKGFYPNPDDGTSITYIWALAWTQWTIWDTVIRNIWKINEKPVDPLTDTEYTYSVANNKKEYQIWFIKEWGLIWLNLPLPQTYAAEKTAIAVIKWNYNEKIIKVLSSWINYILAVPTIINANLKNTDLQTIINNQELVYNNYKNLPDSYKNLWYTMTGSFNYNPTNIVIYSWATIDLTEESEKVVFMTNLQNAYKWTVIQSEDAYQDIININPANTW